MSLKTLLMPAISQRLLSRERLLKRRQQSEHTRQARHEGRQVHYFHQVDDPYSALAAAALPELMARYDIELIAHVVGAPPDSAAPEREKLVAYSRRDAQLLAERFGLAFRDTGMQPAPTAVQDATTMLVAGISDGRFADIAGLVCAALWQGGTGLADLTVGGAPLPRADAASVAGELAAGQALRQSMGHYLGATFFYGGEWYWGIDRLYHLEQRLQALGAHRASVSVSGLMFAPSVDLAIPVRVDTPPDIDFFVSLRSPYSAIVAPRVFELGRLTGASVRLRYVLPMVMRGLPVPPEKRSYISQDAAREAFARGIPFGRLNDPVGRPTERGIALIPLAERLGKGEAYLLSFMRGVWAEGIDAGSDGGLRKIAGRAGLDWNDAQAALKDDTWRSTAEKNREEMFGLGLWGVPSFRVGDVAVWGQDRLWAVEQEILKGKT